MTTSIRVGAGLCSNTGWGRLRRQDQPGLSIRQERQREQQEHISDSGSRVQLEDGEAE